MCILFKVHFTSDSGEGSKGKDNVGLTYCFMQKRDLEINKCSIF